MFRSMAYYGIGMGIKKMQLKWVKQSYLRFSPIDANPPNAPG